MRAKYANRLAGLDQQRLVALEPPERGDDGVVAFPIARRTADAAVDDELVRALGHIRVEVVHEHSQRRFGKPAFCRALRAPGSADGASGVDASHRDLRSECVAKARQAFSTSVSAARIAVAFEGS